MRRKIKDKILESYIKSDLKLLGIPTDFELEFRGYSKTYYGRYYIEEQKVVVYILDEVGKQLPYHEILDTVLHEALHHFQHQHDSSFRRVKGVMHNPQFNKMYDTYINQLRNLEVVPSA